MKALGKFLKHLLDFITVITSVISITTFIALVVVKNGMEHTTIMWCVFGSVIMTNILHKFLGFGIDKPPEV